MSAERLTRWQQAAMRLVDLNGDVTALALWHEGCGNGAAVLSSLARRGLLMRTEWWGEDEGYLYVVPDAEQEQS